MAPKVVHQNMENSEICDVNRFACQLVNYETDYILLITYNDRMKLCRQMVHNKIQFKEYKISLSRQQCQTQALFKDFMVCTLFAFVDEIN